MGAGGAEVGLAAARKKITAGQEALIDELVAFLTRR